MKSSALKQLTAAVASAMVLMSSAHAAGLGKLTVLSALGQPLRAEIELTAVSPEEASGLAARLASPEAFRTANIDFNPALLSLRFNVEQRGGRQFIRVTSSQPLNEPFVDMLLELSWANGRLVREYTFLLDPAELRATQSAQVAPSESHQARPRAEAQAPASAQAAPASEAASERPQRSRVRPAAENTDVPSRAAVAASEGVHGGKYRVKAGDSLGRIAAQLRPVDVSLDMMLVALYRANPDAFIGNNMNRLKSGRILSVPSADAIHGINDEEAHGVVVAQTADFNAYRNKLAGQVGASEPVKAPQAGQSGGGKITAKVEERPTAANESQDQLRLSKAAPTTPAGKGTTMSTEDRIAKQKELEEAQARVKELERNVGDLEKLATIKNKGAAEAQANASAPAASAPEAAKPAAPAAPAKPAHKTLPTIKPATPAPAPEPGLFGFIMDNLTLVGGAAAALLLGGLLAAQRRKKKVVKTVAEPSILGVPSEPAHSLFAETGGQSVDTNNSVFNSSFAPSASQLDTNEVDPVAEADVYIAYGRDAQAEEILKEALRTHPERHPVRLKLLEIYAARKDQRAFETQAGELYSLTRGQGEEWAQAAALGHAIDPLNPLYANNSVHAPEAAHVAHAAAPAASAASAHQDFMSRDLDDAFAAAAATEAAHEPMSFDQHFADAMGTAQPSAKPSAETFAPQAEPAPARAQEDEHTLDFDLGGLSFEPVSNDTPPLDTRDAKEVAAAGDVPDLEFDMGAFEPAAAAAAAEPAPEPAKSADEPLDFSFDMDFGAPAANPVPQPVEAHAAQAADLDDAAFDHDLQFDAPQLDTAPVAHAAPNTEIDMANLAREFDLPDLPTELHEGVPATPEQLSPATELKDPLFELDAMDFGLDEEQPAAPAPALEASMPAIPPLSLDDDPFALPELPTATPAVPSEAAYAEHESIEPSRLDAHFDLPGFDLDLPADGGLPLPEVQEDGGATVAAPAASAAPAELTAQQMEMETKLDLAIAYQEIGDKEGARELLEEVIRGGNPEQAGRASAMRASLA
jgi:pilus assembly protein FimV